jgi:hypothetical protein
MRKSYARISFGKGGLWGFVCLSVILLCSISTRPAQGLETGINGFSLMGYINQGAAYALHDDRPDNKDGFNSFLTQGLIEARYEAAPNFIMFGSLKFNADWAYPIYSGNNEWREKGFSKARDELFIYDKLRDFLGEAHFTWKPITSSTSG